MSSGRFSETTSSEGWSSVAESLRDVAIDLAAVGDDLHGAAAQHVGRADHHG